MIPTIKQTVLLKTELEKRGHSQFFVGWECASVKCGAKGIDISDDTANIISSVKYLNLNKRDFAKEQADSMFKENIINDMNADLKIDISMQDL